MGWEDIISLVATGGAIWAEREGAEEAAEGVEKGAAEQARIEQIKREYVQKQFDADIERQKPFYEAGIAAGVDYPDAVKNKLDVTKSGAYQEQKALIDPTLEDSPQYVKDMAMERLGAVEGEAQKGRLLDLQKIGMGAAGSAGNSSMNLGNVLAQSYGLAGNVQTGADITSSETRQSAWNRAASQITGLPAYLEARKAPTGATTNAVSNAGTNPFITTSNPKGLTPGAGL